MKEYRQDKDDNFFKWKGIKPPVRTSHGMTEDDIESILAKNLAGHKCEWVQRGGIITCTSGEYEHGKKIGVNKMLTGTTPDGAPILVDIVLS